MFDGNNVKSSLGRSESVDPTKIDINRKIRFLNQGNRLQKIEEKSNDESSQMRENNLSYLSDNLSQGALSFNRQLIAREEAEAFEKKTSVLLLSSETNEKEE